MIECIFSQMQPYGAHRLPYYYVPLVPDSESAKLSICIGRHAFSSFSPPSADDVSGYIPPLLGDKSPEFPIQDAPHILNMAMAMPKHFEDMEFGALLDGITVSFA